MAYNHAQHCSSDFSSDAVDLKSNNFIQGVKFPCNMLPYRLPVLNGMVTDATTSYTTTKATSWPFWMHDDEEQVEDFYAITFAAAKLFAYLKNWTTKAFSTR